MTPLDVMLRLSQKNCWRVVVKGAWVQPVGGTGDGTHVEALQVKFKKEHCPFHTTATAPWTDHMILELEYDHRILDSDSTLTIGLWPQHTGLLTTGL